MKIPEPTADCPSGLFTVTDRPPGVAPLSMVMFNVIFVGVLNVTLLTVTPPPPTEAEIWLGKLEPGSKKPDPALDVPVIVTFSVAPAPADDGEAFEGIAGGGALSWVMITPHEPGFVAELERS